MGDGEGLLQIPHQRRGPWEGSIYTKKDEKKSAACQTRQRTFQAQAMANAKALGGMF